MFEDRRSKELTALDPFSIVRPKTDQASPTPQAYDDWQFAYAYFNDRLFTGELPDCLITLTRRSGVFGYFLREAFENGAGEIAHEIAMNPAYLEAQGDAGSLSTLVHEMCHLWRHVHGPRNKKGKPGTPGYHDRVWADKMEEVGLMPSSTGEPGGDRTGYRMSDYIIEGGPFNLYCRELLASGFRINWRDRNAPPVAGASEGCGDSDEGTGSRGRKKKDRQRFICPDCQLKAWAKPSAKLVCGACELPMFATD